MKLKHFILFAVILFIFTRCSKDDKDLISIPLNAPIGYSPDSTFFVFIDNGDILNKVEGDRITYSTNIYMPVKTEHTGYGEIKTIRFRNYTVNVLNSTVVVSGKNGTGEISVNVYDYSLDSITSILKQSGNFQAWGHSGFHIINGSECDRYSETGVFTETITSASFNYPSGDKNIIIDAYNFLKYDDVMISKTHLTSGLKWKKEFKDYVVNKPEGETNMPKIKWKSYSISDGTVSVILTVTYYSGAKEDITLRFNIESGEKQ